MRARGRQRPCFASTIADDGVGGAHGRRRFRPGGIARPARGSRHGARDRERAGSGTDRPRVVPMRVVIADDAPLIREGVARLLIRERRRRRGSGGRRRHAAAHAFATFARTSRWSTSACRRRYTTEGLRAAHEIRAEHPGTAVLVLSQQLEPDYALQLIEERPDHAGYLLKERVGHVEELLDALAARRGRRMRRRSGGRRRFARAQPPGRSARGAHAARTRDPRPDRGRPLEQGHLPSALAQPEDGRDAHQGHLHASSGSKTRRRTTAACSRCSRTCSVSTRSSGGTRARPLRTASAECAGRHAPTCRRPVRIRASSAPKSRTPSGSLDWGRSGR